MVVITIVLTSSGSHSTIHDITVIASFNTAYNLTIKNTSMQFCLTDNAN